MKPNENGLDRTVRIVVGVVALIVAFTALDVMTGAIFGILAAIFGTMMLLTGAMGYCPGYTIMGISTCKKESCGDSCGCRKE